MEVRRQLVSYLLTHCTHILYYVNLFVLHKLVKIEKAKRKLHKEVYFLVLNLTFLLTLFSDATLREPLDPRSVLRQPHRYRQEGLGPRNVHQRRKAHKRRALRDGQFRKFNLS